MIREATTKDIAEIIRLGEELRETSPFVANINPQKARKNLAFFINSKRCLVLVAEHHGEVVGFIVGGIADSWFSDQQMVTDTAFYVRPKYRSYSVGMVKRLRSWGMQFPKVREITLGISTGLDPDERTGRLYEHLGLTRVGGMFTQNLGEQPNE